ncbi:hypothetical protein PGUG_02723 [Meyerozyma guilliermondii ATCC 6260]|uniref:t-SNARE coiled-coil homology domain-containing protein n=1 Tax=Meyerozyma guilliermondii (strain ATCC 6260 / CBS 566 / DSM 6381 / JCM 1539 / NBRC 10279 / NRRL Y-324) TaxID=294746 RepID=A5DHH2_PICGU|nr:uncharacterized protein PGUG_02723 [Meyerozyma guilliermondii ATCC 6260]EDK38625.2 hypothetical protein PGUG_02723 [Meyerozyma guilliermondii ATCC 6260]
MFRDRTNLFLSYRRTISRSVPLSGDRIASLREEEEGLMGSRRHTKYRDDGNTIEMKPIVPTAVDISKDIDVNLSFIKSKTGELNAMYKKLLITAQGDKRVLENSIEQLNYDITKKFEACYVLIKKFEFLQKNYDRLGLDFTANDLAVIENYKKNYAQKLQDTSLLFRNLQNNYMKFLRDDEDESDSLLTSSSYMDTDQNTLIMEEEAKNIEDYSKRVLQETQQVKGANSQYLEQRDREISKLAMGILEISTIFKEMESLVVDQGSVLDRIDYNLANTAQDLKTADKELIKAKGYQKRTTKCKIIFLLSLVVFALFMIVLVKPHGSTKVVEKPSHPQPDKGDRPTIDHPQDPNPDSNPRS